MNSRSHQPPTLGVTVLGDFLLSEGPENVLKNLLNCGVTAVATNPTVTAAATPGTGSFQPPIDGGSSPRQFDRPLFGQRSLWVRSGPSYRPDAKFYTESAYQPRRPNELTDQHGNVIREFIEQAKAAGLKVLFQLGAVQPSGLRDEDRPRLPDGTLARNRMADTGSLASESIRTYNQAYLQDLVAAYPQIDGFRPDWPEMPCYTLNECFHDFSPCVLKSKTVVRVAKAAGHELSEIQQAVNHFFHFLKHQLNDSHLKRLIRDFRQAKLNFSGAAWNLNEFLMTYLSETAPQLKTWLKIKQALSTETLRIWRDGLDDLSQQQRLILAANAFMTDYTALTGFTFSKASSICDSVSPKLYTMHWSQMVNFWCTAILAENQQINKKLLVETIETLFDLTNTPGERTLEDYGYPAPEEPHPIADGPQIRKLQSVIKQVGSNCKSVPLVHGYGPASDFKRRLELLTQVDVDGVWINRYGYLSDEKLQIVQEFHSRM